MNLSPQSATDRAMGAFRKLVLSVYPAAIYWIVHEYSVVTSDGLTFSGRPTDESFSPALPTNVPYAPALAGTSSIVPAGTLAYVGFANADPSKPYLVRFGSGLPTDTTIDATDTISIGLDASKIFLGGTTVATAPTTAAAERRVVCYGDNLSVGSAAGPITLVSLSCSKVSA